jgi:hypothetical protein
MAAPEDGTFTTADAAMDALTAAARSNGYGVSKQRTFHSKLKEPSCIDVQCDRSGKFKEERNAIRKTSTRKTDCPFRCRILRQ